MERFQLNGCMASEIEGLSIQWGFEIGCSVFVECYQNKLVILKGQERKVPEDRFSAYCNLPEGCV